MQTKDGYLVQQCLSGEQEAFGVLVDRYKSSMYALAVSKIGNFDDAEDITQEAFIKAYRNLGKLRRWDHFYTWLYSITSNLCKDWIKAQSKRGEEAYLKDVATEDLESSSLSVHREKEVHEAVREALAELPEIYREVLTLYYLAGMNSKEIAHVLGAKPSTIDKRLSRARKMLKQEMLTMMSTTFDEMRLQPSFTFRVVEAIKRTKIQTPPSKAQLPFSVSAAVGLIVLMLSLTIPHSPIYPIGEWIGSALPSQTQVPEVGVIPVDTIEVTKITILSSKTGSGDFGQKPKPNNPIKAFGAGTWERKTDMPTARYVTGGGVVDGKIYVIGGAPVEFGITATVEAYDPIADSWTK